MSSSAFELALTKYDRLIWALSIRFGKGIEGMDVEDVVQEGRIKLFEILEQHGFRPESELAAIFKKSLVNRILDLRRKTKAERDTIVLDLEEVAQAMGDDGFSDLFLKHYQEHLATMVSPEAALLLENILNPSDAILEAHLVQTLRREHLKRQGFKVNVTRKLTHQLVGSMLGFSSSKTKRLMSQLQDACVTHLGLRPWTMSCSQPTAA